MLLTRIALALNRHKIPYAIAGGYAVALHGALRGTVDVDLVIPLRLADYERAEVALRSIGLEPRLPVTAQEVFTFRDEYMRNRNLVAWSFINPNAPADMVDIIITHDLTRMKRIKMTINGTTIHLLSIDSLIAMKQAAGRPQDLEDIRALKAIRSQS